jgi:hypothetical protein
MKDNIEEAILNLNLADPDAENGTLITIFELRNLFE